VLSIGAKLVLWLVPIWSGLGGVEVWIGNFDWGSSGRKVRCRDGSHGCVQWRRVLS
jgi:hypothetical protein